MWGDDASKLRPTASLCAEGTEGCIYTGHNEEGMTPSHLIDLGILFKLMDEKWRKKNYGFVFMPYSSTNCHKGYL